MRKATLRTPSNHPSAHWGQQPLRILAIGLRIFSAQQPKPHSFDAKFVSGCLGTDIANLWPMPRTTMLSIMMVSALGLAGCDKSTSGDQQAQTDASVAAAPTSGPIAITADDKGFQPSRVEVKQGNAVTLRFTRTSDDTCATAVVFPELSINKPLPLNQAVDVTIPANKARTLSFQCGMGMYKSQVVVL